MYQLSVFLHIISAMGWVGGMLFLALVVVPVARRLPAAERADLLHAAGQRFRVVGWTFVAILIVTGLINAGYRGMTWGDLVTGAIFETTFGQILMIKVAVVAVMIALTALHDFVVGPAMTRALAQGATAPDAGRLRRRGSWLARVSLLLALVIVALAVMLVRGLPW